MTDDTVNVRRADFEEWIAALNEGTQIEGVRRANQERQKIAAATMITNSSAGEPEPPPPVKTGSKLGPHIDSAGGNVQLDELKTVDFALVNIGFDIRKGAQMIADGLNANPRLRVILKNSHPDKAEKLWLLGPALLGEWWSYQVEAYNILLQSGADLQRVYWKAANELEYPNNDAEKVERIINLNAWETQRMLMLEDRGTKAAIGVFSWGTPELNSFTPGGDQWHFFNGAMSQAHLGRHMLALNEYWFYEGPYTLYNDANVRRYRRVWNEVIVPNGWSNILVGLAEVALGKNEHERVGYRQLVAHEEYLAQLITLDGWLQEDDYVAGAAIYVQSPQNPVWESFDIGREDFRVPLFDYIRNTKE